MKILNVTKSILPMFFMLFNQALAQESASIDLNNVKINSNESIKILGRGVYNKKYNESMALACYNKECTKIRMVIFSNSNHEAYYTGRIFDLPGGIESNENEVKNFLKSFTHQYRHALDHYRKALHPQFTDDRKLALVIVVTMPLFFAGTPIGATALAIGASAYFFKPGFFNMSPTVASFNDKDGWSWSSKPKKISKLKYGALKRFVSKNYVDLCDPML